MHVPIFLEKYDEMSGSRLLHIPVLAVFESVSGGVTVCVKPTNVFANALTSYV